ncbi:MAG: DEAD/DEAH box helicase [Sphingobacteriales bacterium]|nr:MAG: DEAD/DEAH box helicase [Sphingobacteriales bacterium]
MEIQSFNDFELDYDVLDGIEAMGYRTPTPIQKQAIPLILGGKDLIATAQTGTGKTAAFILPILDAVLRAPKGRLNTLVLVPTRELAQQIDQQVEAMSYYVDVSCIAVYGGTDGITFEAQKKALRSGTDIIVATPGRLIALMQMGSLDFSTIRHLVLDEADRMLDMGFYEDLIRIVSALPKDRQTLLFSATMAPKIKTLAGAILKQPEEIRIAVNKPAEAIVQKIFMVQNEEKNKLVSYLFKTDAYQSAIIFASRKETVRRLERELRKEGLKCKAFSSDLEQDERTLLMQDFKARKLPILIGTDVLSRGIDIEGIELVLNYDVPPDPEDYVHRIGRTARAQRTGTAITFVNSDDVSRFTRIEKMIGKELPATPLPEGFVSVVDIKGGDRPRTFSGKKTSKNTHGTSRQEGRRRPS